MGTIQCRALMMISIVGLTGCSKIDSYIDGHKKADPLNDIGENGDNLPSSSASQSSSIDYGKMSENALMYMKRSWERSESFAWVYKNQRKAAERHAKHTRETANIEQRFYENSRICSLVRNNPNDIIIQSSVSRSIQSMKKALESSQACAISAETLAENRKNNAARAEDAVNRERIMYENMLNRWAINKQ